MSKFYKPDEEEQLTFAETRSYGIVERDELERGKRYKNKRKPPEQRKKEQEQAAQQAVDDYWKAFEDFVRSAGRLAKFYKNYIMKDESEKAARAIQHFIKAARAHGSQASTEELFFNKCNDVAWKLSKLYGAAKVAGIVRNPRYIYVVELTGQLVYQNRPPFRGYQKERSLIEQFCLCSSTERSWFYNTFLPNAKKTKSRCTPEEVGKLFRQHFSK